MISRLILIDSEPRLSAGLTLGLQPEGIAVAEVDATDLAEDGGQAILLRCRNGTEEHVERIRAIRQVARHAPLISFGGNDRMAALRAGATEVFDESAYLRDVITVVKVLGSPKQGQPGVFAGELADHYGLFYLARAISALGKSAVLTLVRGLRRGELRFYQGEVTSAQLGMLHGLSALHQLMLWTEGRFELRAEMVVRRAQIPLAQHEVFDDVERFLSDLRTQAGGLSPSQVYEQVGEALRGAELPEAVLGILRLFDGQRIFADVVEDSPYRILETLPIAARLFELGYIRRASVARPRQSSRAVLPNEAWLVGVGNNAQDEVTPGAEVDWAELIPRGAQHNSSDGFSPVVPSTSTFGEIDSSASAASVGKMLAQRDGLEKVDVGARANIFPADVTDEEISAEAVERRAAEARKREAQAIARRALERMHEDEAHDDAPGGPEEASSAPPVEDGVPEPVAKSTSGEMTAASPPPAATVAPNGGMATVEVDRELVALASEPRGQRSTAKEAVPTSADGSLSGEIVAVRNSSEGSGPVSGPSIVVDGIDVTAEAREAAVRATAAARFDAGRQDEEKTMPGKRVPGFGGVPLAKAEAAGAPGSAATRSGPPTVAVGDSEPSPARHHKDSKKDSKKKRRKKRAGATSPAAPATTPATPATPAPAAASKTAEVPAPAAASKTAEVPAPAAASKSPPPGGSPQVLATGGAPAAPAAPGPTLAEAAAEDAAAAVRRKRASTTPVSNETAPAADPALPDLAGSALTGKAEQVTADARAAASEAAAFSEDEEAFFAAGSRISKAKTVNVETFDDLDEEYEVPKTFWQRFWSNPSEVPKKKDEVAGKGSGRKK